MNSKHILWGVLGVVAITFFWGLSINNRMVTLDESVTAQWSQVENQLQRRYDLVPNLVNAVKGVAAHETKVFTAISDARAKMAGAKSQNEKVLASQQMESALSRLLVVVENYPNLKANESFNRLMDELAGSENRISVERRRYNENVKEYNLNTRKFPNRFLVGILGFEKRPYFEIDEAAKSTPKVEF